MTTAISELPFELETEVERTIVRDPWWQEGITWGIPRPGHPEGQVLFHIHDVLINVDRFCGSVSERSRLRLVALIHDTFKWQSSKLTPKQSHGYVARRFAERYIDDLAVLQVIELHDEAYKAYLLMQRDHDHIAAEQRIASLIRVLGDNITLFSNFYLCDNRTGDKSPVSYAWFSDVVATNTLHQDAHRSLSDHALDGGFHHQSCESRCND